MSHAEPCEYLPGAGHSARARGVRKIYEMIHQHNDLVFVNTRTTA